MTRNLRQILIAVCVFVTASCASPAPAPDIDYSQEIAQQNRERIMLLEKGNTVSDMLRIMGPPKYLNKGGLNNPYRREMYSGSGGESINVYYYYENRLKADYVVDDDELAPVVFVDGKLDGIGWSYFKTVIARYKLDVRIR